MDELLEIIQILSSNIMKNYDKPISKAFSASLARFSHLEIVGDVLNFDHKSHSGIHMKLRHCQQNHCLECMENKLETLKCSHGKPLTFYEKTLIPILILKLGRMDESRISHFTCNTCRENFDIEMLSQRDCECRVCDKCLVKSYKERKLKCKICQKKVTIEVISEIAEKDNVKGIEELEECKWCKLVFASISLTDAVCFFCLEREKLQQ